jgi:hypothetical protein
MSKVRLVGIDTSLKRGQDYITVTHDLDEKRLLFASHGRDHDAIEQFAADLQAHGGDRTAIAHARIDMSAAYAKGIEKSLPNAQISYDRYHVVALANKAMDEVRKAEWKDDSQRVLEQLGELDPRERRSIMWGMRRNPSGWSATQANAMHWLQRANLKTARAWRLKMGLRQVFTHARSHNHATRAAADLRRWISWARPSRLDPFKRLGKTLNEHFEGVVRGMLEHRSNAFVEAMNGILQQAKRAARGAVQVGQGFGQGLVVEFVQAPDVRAVVRGFAGRHDEQSRAGQTASAESPGDLERHQGAEAMAEQCKRPVRMRGDEASQRVDQHREGVDAGFEQSRAASGQLHGEHLNVAAQRSLPRQVAADAAARIRKTEQA